MKEYFRIAFKVYGVFTILALVAWPVYMIIDDYVFIKRMSGSDILIWIGLWAGYFVIYFAFLSVLFWILTALGVLVYKKIKIK